MNKYQLPYCLCFVIGDIGCHLFSKVQIQAKGYLPCHLLHFLRPKQEIKDKIYEKVLSWFGHILYQNLLSIYLIILLL